MLLLEKVCSEAVAVTI